MEQLCFLLFRFYDIIKIIRSVLFFPRYQKHTKDMHVIFQLYRMFHLLLGSKVLEDPDMEEEYNYAKDHINTTSL